MAITMKQDLLRK